jgi:hypothetical protein
MTPLGSAGRGPTNTASILREAKARVSAKRSGTSATREQALTPLEGLIISRVNEFEQRVEEDGLLTTVIYDAFGRFRRAILPKGKMLDLYM